MARDSTYAPALEHLGRLLSEIGDTTGVRWSLGRVLALDSTSRQAAFHRWYASLVLQDTSLRRLIDRDSLSRLFGSTTEVAFERGLGIAEADSLAALRVRTAPTEQERDRVAALVQQYYRMRGWPERARSVGVSPGTPVDRARLALAFRYGDGDSSDAARLAQSVRGVLPLPPQGPDGEETSFALAQYDLSVGRENTARQVSRILRGIKEADELGGIGYSAPYYALLLETQLAAIDHAADARVRLESLDSALQTVPENGIFELVGNLVAARLWDVAGDLPRALVSIRRRRFADGMSPIFMTYLREEGRLAALTGDRRGALNAYRRYLDLRSSAEPLMQPQLQAVRSEVRALEGSLTDR